MQRNLGRVVSRREDNVLWVDFSRDPDPPAPRFPGARGLRATGDERTRTTGSISDVLPISAAAKRCPGAERGSVNASPNGPTKPLIHRYTSSFRSKIKCCVDRLRPPPQADKNRLSAFVR